MKEIKWFIVLASVLAVLVMTGANSCSRKRYAKQVVLTSELQLKNSLLMEDVRLRDIMLKAKDSKISMIEINLIAAESQKRVLTLKYNELMGDYSELAKKINGIKTQESYGFLIGAAYPFPGEYKYPFNESQVKGIHLTFLEKAQLEGINENLLKQVSNCESRIEKKDSLIELRNEKILLLNQTRNDLDSILINMNSAAESNEKNIKKEVSKKKLWKVVSTILVGALIGTNI